MSVAALRWCLPFALCLSAACSESPRPASLPPSRIDVVLPATDAVTVVRDAPSAIDAGGGVDVVDASVERSDVPLDLNPTRPYPSGPYGGLVGSAPPPFTLPDCAGMPYSFGGPAFVQSRATVLALFTGTCPTCVGDARALQTLAGEFSPRGVRVVEVLLEGAAPMEQPDARFCTQWRTSAGVTHPVLLDVSRTLDAINPPPRAFPLVLVIDAAGIIRGRFAMDQNWASAARLMLTMLVP